MTLTIQFVDFNQTNSTYTIQLCAEHDARVTFRVSHPDLRSAKALAAQMLLTLSISNVEQTARLDSLCDKVSRRNHAAKV